MSARLATRRAARPHLVCGRTRCRATASASPGTGTIQGEAVGHVASLPARSSGFDARRPLAPHLESPGQTPVAQRQSARPTLGRPRGSTPAGTTVTEAEVVEAPDCDSGPSRCESGRSPQPPRRHPRLPARPAFRTPRVARWPSGTHSPRPPGSIRHDTRDGPRSRQHWVELQVGLTSAPPWSLRAPPIPMRCVPASSPRCRLQSALCGGMARAKTNTACARVTCARCAAAIGRRGRWRAGNAAIPAASAPPGVAVAAAMSIATPTEARAC